LARRTNCALIATMTVLADISKNRRRKFPNVTGLSFNVSAVDLAHAAAEQR
jgi:hypothetical protein